MKYRISIIILLISMIPQYINAEAQSYMDVHYINVGQGDSILIKTPNGKTILIDGGLPEAGEKVVSYLKDQKVRQIDLLVATHPDYDHIGGLVYVMKEFDIKLLLDSGKFHLTRAFTRYNSEIRKQGILKKIAEEGQKIHIDSNLSIDVLNAHEKSDSNNESSIVLKITYHDIDFLFMADATMEEEKKIMEKYNIESEILKVAHHGSDTSSSLEFLRKVNPNIAILTFSVDNDFGHPVERVVENLDRVDALVYSTASYGDIIIRTNGEEYLIFSNENPTDQLTKSSA